jgi:hypothetical protein
VRASAPFVLTSSEQGEEVGQVEDMRRTLGQLIAPVKLPSDSEHELGRLLRQEGLDLATAEPDDLEAGRAAYLRAGIAPEHALALMLEHGAAQLPVLGEDGGVIGFAVREELECHTGAAGSSPAGAR